MSQPTELISGNQYRVAHIYTDKGNPHLKGHEFSGWLAVNGRTIGMTGGIRPRSYLHAIGTQTRSAKEENRAFCSQQPGGALSSLAQFVQPVVGRLDLARSLDADEIWGLAQFWRTTPR
jgi:hypothetical protein